MKLIPVFLFAIVIAMSSCSSAYKTAQTPDDVYYSPGRQQTNDEYYSPNSRNNNGNNQGEYYNANPNDQYLMMKVQDPSRWSTFDDYGYDSYSYYPSSGFSMGYYGGYYSPWSSYGLWNPYFSFYNCYYAWNAFYNPYYYSGNVVYVGGKTSSYNNYAGLHPFNAAAYRNNTFSNSNSRSYTGGGNSFNRNGNSFNNGNVSRRTFYKQQSQNNNNFNNNRTFTQPTRSYTPSNSSFGSGGGSRSGGGGGFSRPGKP